jgi:hypothetical protein
LGLEKVCVSSCAANTVGEQDFRFHTDVQPNIYGSFQKTSIPPPPRKLEINPLSDVLKHLLLSETILFPLHTAEISSVGGVWIFSGTTLFYRIFALLTA